MDAGDGHAAFAHSGGATFYRPGPDIARGKNTRKAGLERAWAGVCSFSRRANPPRSEPVLINPFSSRSISPRQPFGAGIGANHGKNGGRSDHAPFAGLGVFQLGFFQLFSRQTICESRCERESRCSLSLPPVAKDRSTSLERSPPRITRSDFGGAIGKEHRGLARRIAAAGDDDSFPATNLTFERGRGIINAHAFKLFAALRLQVGGNSRRSRSGHFSLAARPRNHRLADRRRIHRPPS